MEQATLKQKFQTNARNYDSFLNNKKQVIEDYSDIDLYMRDNKSTYQPSKKTKETNNTNQSNMSMVYQQAAPLEKLQHIKDNSNDKPVKKSLNNSLLMKGLLIGFVMIIAVIGLYVLAQSEWVKHSLPLPLGKSNDDKKNDVLQNDVASTQNNTLPFNNKAAYG